MLSAFFIYNQKGDILISRYYRQDLERQAADLFRVHVITNNDVRSPVLTLGSSTYLHIRHEDIFLAGVTRRNANAALIFETLHRIVSVGQSYFGKFDGESVKDNFVVVYEILDEMVDFGYSQTTDVESLKSYISAEGTRSHRVQTKDMSKITNQATGSIPWRRSDIKYKKNEAFVDVVESVNLLLGPNGSILKSDVSGQILMRAYLSGMPECKFGLNDRLTLARDDHTGPSQAQRDSDVAIDDAQFHQCVQLGQFHTDRTISFVPPDGEFELMRYRTADNVNLPFKVQVVVEEEGRSGIQYNVAVKANFSTKLFASAVTIRIPTPLNTTGVTLRVSGDASKLGKCKYVPEENAIVWRISRWQGGVEMALGAEAKLGFETVRRTWSKPPISMDFEVLMFTSSGVLVRFLRVFEKTGYTSVKWVRYMTRAGSYQIRF